MTSLLNRLYERHPFLTTWAFILVGGVLIGWLETPR